jgi:AAA domain
MKTPDANDKRATKAPDINDTLLNEGPDAVRGRHDRAQKYNGPQAKSPPSLTLEEWLNRKLPEPDLLLPLLSTTSRVLINAPTGIGKTMLGIAIAMALAAGSGFLHWRGIRPARTLFIDGEMSSRLLQQRLKDEVIRLGNTPKDMHVFSHEDIEGFAPLNTPEGQACIEALIRRIGDLDLIIFDNIMSLIAGDMKDEESWRAALPWVKSLTKREIGQMWLHHTGHDETRGYGTKTREWQMDTVIHLEEVKRPDTDVSFQFGFRKARERRPENRAAFANVCIALINDQWTSDFAEKATTKAKVSPLARKFHNALANATIGSLATKMFSCPTATIEEWRGECIKIGLLDKDRDHSARTLFSKYKRELIAANWIACNETMAWTLP